MDLGKLTLVILPLSMMLVVTTAAVASSPEEQRAETVLADFYQAVTGKGQTDPGRFTVRGYDLSREALAGIVENYGRHQVVETLERKLPGGKTIYSFTVREYDKGGKPGTLQVYTLEKVEDKWFIADRRLLSADSSRDLLKQYRRLVWSSTMEIVSLMFLLILSVSSLILGGYTIKRFDPQYFTRMQLFYGFFVTTVAGFTLVFVCYYILTLMRAG